MARARLFGICNRNVTFCITECSGLPSMSFSEARSPAQQRGNNLPDLLRRFQDTHHLRLEQLAGLLRITPQTLEEWFRKAWHRPHPVWPLQSCSIPEISASSAGQAFDVKRFFFFGLSTKKKSCCIFCNKDWDVSLTRSKSPKAKTKRSVT